MLSAAAGFFDSKIKRPAEAGRLFLICCRRACRLGRDSVSAGRVFDLGFDPAGRASGLDFDSADLVYRWASQPPMVRCRYKPPECGHGSNEREFHPAICQASLLNLT